jgi:hypothetical protein
VTAQNPRGRVLGVVESHAAGSTNRSARVTTQVTYHGGAVQHSSSVYVIFWVPSGYAMPSGYTTTIPQYFTDVSHDSYTAANTYGVSPQYYDKTKGAKKFGSYNVAYKSSGLDTRAFPANGCPNYVLGDGSTTKVCLTQAQIEKELTSVVASHHLPTGLGNQYFLFTPQGVASCSNATSLSTGGCYDPLQFNGFCAFHSHFGSGSHVVIYANMPYSALAGCSSGQSPNGNAADAVLNNVSHEHIETITDPLGNAWYDGSGNEIADKCHLAFGAALGSTATGQFNEVINGHGYWLQQVWSNRAHGCVQRNTFPQPVASFTYKPSLPVHGKKVTFASSVSEAGETAFTYRWTFPDGGVGAVPRPSHKFATAIFAGTVTLIVSDKWGNQTRVVRSISIT